MGNPEFSVVLSYYCSPEDLRRQIVLWNFLEPKWLDKMEFIIVDDGSPHSPLTPDLMQELVKDLAGQPRIRAYRLLKDIGFNNLGARNLGAFVALGTYLIFIDMDCLLFPYGGMATRVLKDIRERVRPELPHILYFRRFVLPLGNLSIKATVAALRNRRKITESLSPNSFATLRSQFWSIGGFNEDLSGMYGTDYEFWARIHRLGYRKVTDAKGHIVTLNYGPKRRPAPHRPCSEFPTNPLRLPWTHVWSSESYLRMVEDKDLALRLAPIHSMPSKSSFPILDLPAFSNISSVAAKRPMSIFGISKEIGRAKDLPPKKGKSPHFSHKSSSQSSKMSRFLRRLG